MKLRIVWDKQNNNSWSEIITFKINPIKHTEIEDNCEQILQGDDGNWDFYCCGQDNISSKMEYHFTINCFTDQYNKLFEAYTHCFNTSKTYQWIQGYFNNYTSYKNLVFVGKWPDVQYTTLIPNINQTMYIFNLQLREK